MLATFDKYDQSVIYMNTADYTNSSPNSTSRKGGHQAAGAGVRLRSNNSPESENLISSGPATKIAKSRLWSNCVLSPYPIGRFDKDDAANDCAAQGAKPPSR